MSAWLIPQPAIDVRHGDCLDVMRAMDAASVDAVVSDPPYGLAFMGKHWDHGVPGVAFWAEALRVLKPGGHLLAFGGTRTYHRLACAVEDAGFEVRDMLAWMYGQGFSKVGMLRNRHPEIFCACEPPTEHDVRPVPRADLPPTQHAHDERGQVLFEGVPEPRSPDEKHATNSGAARAREPSVEGRDLHRAWQGLPDGEVSGGARGDGAGERLRPGAPAGDGAELRARSHSTGGSASPERDSDGQPTVEPQALRDTPGALDGAPRERRLSCSRCGGLSPEFRGLGGSLKPAHEPIVMARKRLTGTVAANVQAHGTGAVNVDGCRVGSEGGTAWEDQGKARTPGFAMGGCTPHETGQGRWPANVILDPEAAAMLDEQSGELASGSRAPGVRAGMGFHGASGDGGPAIDGDSGGASRFFYTAKPAASERGKSNKHPTVKPIALMRWLVRLVTPPGGLVLDPFAGSGTTGLAASAEGFRSILIEREDAYVEIIKARIAERDR